MPLIFQLHIHGIKPREFGKKKNLTIMSHQINDKEKSKSNKQLSEKKECKKKNAEVKCILYKKVISI